MVRGSSAKDAPLTSPPLGMAATRALTVTPAAAPARSRPRAPRAPGGPSLDSPRLAPRPRPPTGRAPLSPPGGDRPQPARGCTRSPRGSCSYAARPRPASPPEPRLLVSPGPAEAAVVARLRLLTGELERPGQHSRHGGGPDARARARVLPGRVVRSGRRAGPGPAKVGAARRRGAGERRELRPPAPACTPLLALPLAAPSRTPHLASPFPARVSLSCSAKRGNGNCPRGLQWSRREIAGITGKRRL